METAVIEVVFKDKSKAEEFATRAAGLAAELNGTAISEFTCPTSASEKKNYDELVS